MKSEDFPFSLSFSQMTFDSFLLVYFMISFPSVFPDT